MPKTGDSYVVTLKEAHLGWGTYRKTTSRGRVRGEAYIQIPRPKARQFEIYNSNNKSANTLYQCMSIDGFYSGTLLAQGCNKGGDIFAKQFAEKGNLKGLGKWYSAVGAKPGDKVEIVFTSPSSLTIEHI